VQIASAKTFFATFGGHILGPAEGVGRCEVSGWGCGRLRSQPSSLSLRCATEVDDQSFEIEIRNGPALPTWVALHSLLLQSLHPEIPLAEVDGIAVRITGPHAAFNGLALRRLSEEELATLIREHRSGLSAAGKAVPKS
jgi:hypothetical protein